MTFGMIKTVRGLDQKLTECEDGSWLYQKSEDQPKIKVYPANLARQTLAKGYHKSVANETDEYLREYTIDNSTMLPVVCVLPQLDGCYIPGVITMDRNSMTIHDIPTHDPCDAARLAHCMMMGKDVEALAFEAA